MKRPKTIEQGLYSHLIHSAYSTSFSSFQIPCGNSSLHRHHKAGEKYNHTQGKEAKSKAPLLPSSPPPPLPSPIYSGLCLWRLYTVNRIATLNKNYHFKQEVDEGPACTGDCSRLPYLACTLLPFITFSNPPFSPLLLTLVPTSESGHQTSTTRYR